MLPENKPHILTYPFDFASKHNGGLPRVIEDTARNYPELDISIFSTDKRDQTLEGMKLKVASEGAFSDPSIFRLWFGTGNWCDLHPRAHTLEAQTPQAIKAMYPSQLADPVLEKLAREMKEGAEVPKPGSMAFLISYLNEYAPPNSLARSFNSKFSGLFANITPGSIVNFQDYFFADSIIAHADRLRAEGSFQTWHLHTTVPDTLVLTEFGQNVLLAASKVDTVYVHTDAYKRDLQAQLQQLLEHGQISQIPQVKVFNLGIDRNNIDQCTQAIHRDNYSLGSSERSHTQGIDLDLSKLSARQSALVHEVFKSEGVVPNRFICLDRLDPGKGGLTVLMAVEQMLDGALETRGLAYVRENYRFFFLHDQLVESNPNPLNIKEMHAYHVAMEYRRLQEKFPEVFWVSEGISGANKALLPAMMRGCHGITGGAQDGLNLACMEIAYANKNLPTAVIVGSGAGVAIAASEQNLTDSIFFPKAGDVDNFRLAFEKTVEWAASDPRGLREAKGRFVDWVAKRNDSVVVSS